MMEDVLKRLEDLEKKIADQQACLNIVIEALKNMGLNFDHIWKVSQKQS